MKNHLHIFFLLFFLVFVSGCNKYNDSEVWNSIHSLEERMSAMETVMNAYKNNILIKSVQPIENGYIITFSDGSTATILNGVDGEDGKDGDTYIQTITIGENEVTFILSNGQTFSIALYNALSLEFDTEDLLLMLGNQTRQIGYKVTSAIEDIDIEVISSADIKAKVVKNQEGDPLSGIIQITTGDVVDTEYSKVVVIVTNGERIIMRKLAFTNEGIEVYDNTEKVAESTGGDLELEFISSMPYEVVIPEDAQSWVSYNPTRAAERQSIVLTLAANEGYSRSTQVTINGVGSDLSVVFEVSQKSDREFIETQERPVLEEIYESLGGATWTYQTNWCTDAPISDWEGVTVDEISGRVIGLHFNDFYLAGEIPASIGELTELQTLYFYCASITKLPEEMSKLQKLESLTIGARFNEGDHLSGSLPACLYSLSALKYLDIHHHKISSLSSDIVKLKNLEYLMLSNNEISNELPQEIGTLENLKELWLGGNRITGEIPASIGNLRHLETLELGLNSFSGHIPPEIGNLTNLKTLSLGDNSLSGQIPSTLSNLTKLESLGVGGNQLSGGIPYLGNMPNLEVINMEVNQLSGTIPEEISELRHLRSLTLFSNQLTGLIPEGIGNSTELELLHLNYNQLTGTIPESLANAPKLNSIWLDHNQLYGKVPETFYNRSWWRNSWGSIVVGNNFDFSDAPFPGPNFTMDVDVLGDGRFQIAEEYAQNKYTLLFQWSATCPYIESATEMLIELHNQYSDKGLKIIGRSYMETATYNKIKELNMPWKTYFSQQLDYPTYLVPTITVIDQNGLVAFSDLLQNRDELPMFFKQEFGI